VLQTAQHKLCQHNQPPNISKYEKSEIYQITCPTCNMKHEAHGTDRQVVQHPFPRTPTRHQVRIRQIQIRPAPARQRTCHRPHGGHHGHPIIHQ